MPEQTMMRQVPQVAFPPQLWSTEIFMCRSVSRIVSAKGPVRVQSLSLLANVGADVFLRILLM